MNMSVPRDRALSVATVLEGSLRVAGNKLSSSTWPTASISKEAHEGRLRSGAKNIEIF